MGTHAVRGVGLAKAFVATALASGMVLALAWTEAGATPSAAASGGVLSVARQFRHNGLPIVRLWQSGQNLIAIGLNPHGIPGIYFTQRLKD